MYSPVWALFGWEQVGYGGFVSEVNQLAAFEPIGRVTADGRRRVPLGQTAVLPGAKYSVFQHPDGSILLSPVATQQKKESDDA